MAVFAVLCRLANAFELAPDGAATLRETGAGEDGDVALTLDVADDCGVAAMPGAVWFEVREEAAAQVGGAELPHLPGTGLSWLHPG